MELSEIFDEWNTYSMQKKLLPRDIDLDAIIENSRHKIIAISGIRRSGKSSILTLIAQRIVEKGGKCGYVNVEDSRFGEHINLLDEILEWFGDEGFLRLPVMINDLAVPHSSVQSIMPLNSLSFVSRASAS